MWHRVSLIVGSNHAKFNFMAKTKYTCSYQLVFAISTVNFVIMCYFLKIADQVDCQLYLHSYLIFFAIVQTVKNENKYFAKASKCGKISKGDWGYKVCICSVQFIAKPVFNINLRLILFANFTLLKKNLTWNKSFPIYPLISIVH